MLKIGKPRRHKYPGAKENDDEGDIADRNDDEDFITVQDALKLVRDPLLDTQASEEVERTTWRRISGYPAAARQHVHITKAYVPIDIARALSIDSTLVQKPVETFYTRDAIQLRAAHKMSRFPPEPSTLTTVKMTRTAYAQLVGQKFYPPKIFGRWQEKEGTKEWRWRDVGMKIACGFEMLYQESKGRSEIAQLSSEVLRSSAEAQKDALRRNPEYSKYIQNLVSSGYFKGELEGSQLWSTLEDQAVNAYVENRREDDATRPSFVAAVQRAVLRAGNGPISPDQEEDSDEWLNVNADDFDSMLEKNYAGQYTTKPNSSSDAMNIDKSEETQEDRLAKDQASRLQNLAKKVEEFVEGEGDIEGARFADEAFSDEEFSDENMSLSGTEPSDEELPPQQTKAERAARQAAMDKLVPGLDPSEYGKMPPSFHSNSQRIAPTTMETEMREEISPQGSSASTSEPRKRPIRPAIIPRDKYEGVDSDDETDDEDGGGGDEEEEEDQPQIVGEVEIDMEGEEDEFLEFARQALGLSDQQWNDIVRERKGRGAYVPTHIVTESRVRKQTSATSTETTFDTTSPGRAPTPGPRPNVNPSLDSFEAVMQAMDVELARSRAGRQSSVAPMMDKGKGTEAVDVSRSMDIEAAMDAELHAALAKDFHDDDDDNDIGQGADYNLIKNFLESFKGQAGLSGPVSNLAGRLQPGWTLPRDDA
ncbi:hypothetical protein AcV5_004245 [Taiwanofungus camphoratus]|nr:hypothetical protein AcV5_004245 [Antrodia cinnamomea]KAI0961199.1 hypothetical protein AcV7_000365 [Antrodia cinnamomea]